MTRMVVTDAQNWYACFGVTPSPANVSGGDFVEEIYIPAPPGRAAIPLSWDEPDASVRVRYEVDGRVVLDLFRETVSLLTAAPG